MRLQKIHEKIQKIIIFNVLILSNIMYLILL